MQLVLELQTPLEVETVEVEHLLVLLQDLDTHQHQELLYKALFTETSMVVMERRAASIKQVVEVVLVVLQDLDLVVEKVELVFKYLLVGLTTTGEAAAEPAA